MKVSDYIISFLEDIGVKHVFTLSGGAILHILDSLGKSKKIKYICCHHEQAVAIASEAYSRVSKHIGVSLVTSGPGSTNAITGVACSWIDSVPHLVLSGQVFSGQTMGSSKVRQIGIQEINIIEIVKPITKYAVMITDANKIKYHLQKAYYLARNGRPGPVWLDIPVDIQIAQVDKNSLEEFNPDEINIAQEPKLKQKISEVVDLLKTAKRPLICVGQGIKIANAVEEFLEFCERHRLPFITARNANDIVQSDHELFIGRHGTWGTRPANFAVQTCDLLICIGTRLDLSQTGYDCKNFARNAKKVVIDIDYNELHKFTINADIPINSDAKVFIKELSRQMANIHIDTEEWLRRCQTWKGKYPVVLPEYKNQRYKVNAYYFIDVLSDILSNDDIITTDMGLAFQCTHQAFKIKKGQKLFTNSGLAPMGYGLPAAVGACVSSNNKRVICISGEGGLQLNIQELQTVVYNNLPVKLFVFSNGGYLTIKNSLEHGFDGRLIAEGPKSGLSFPDPIKIAKAYGIKAFKISNQNNLYNQIKEVVDSDGHSVCNVLIDENLVQMPRVLNRKKEDGSIEQTPYEDMFPYLDRDEFKENVKI